MRRSLLPLLAAGAALLSVPDPAAQTPEVPVGFALLPAWASLPLLHDRPCHQASSWDRRGGNSDAGNFLRVEADGEQVMLETAGPGCIHRLWTTGVARPGTPVSEAPECRFRFWLDGEERPRLDLSVAELFGLQGRHPFVPPLARTFASGRGPWEGHASLCYVPIPFQRKIKVTGRNLSFYHIDYHLYPPGTAVRSFALPLAPAEEEALGRGAALFARAGEPPVPLAAPLASALDGGPLLLEPGGSLARRWSGAGSIDALWLRLAPETPETLRGVALEIRWDGSQEPSVRVPAGDLFGSGADARRFRALPFGMTGEGCYLYFPMPFAAGCELTVRNDLDRPVAVARLDLSVRPLPGVPAAAGRFHAAYRDQADIPKGTDFRILQAAGRGKLLGCNVTMQSNPRAEGIFFLEGDEKIYADGEGWPSRYLGTGTEDYFNGAYFWNAVRFEHGPVSGLTFLDWGIRRVCAYRVHFPDDVSFARSLVFDLEHGPVSDHPSDYQAVAWWYQLPAAAAPALPPVPDRLPRTIVPPPRRPPAAVALDEAPAARQGTAAVRPWREVSPLLTGAAVAVLAPAGGRGLWAWGFAVPAAERYALAVELAKGPEGGSVRVLLPGGGEGPVAATGDDAWRPGQALELGERLLAPGRHELGLAWVPGPGARILWTGISVRPTSPFVDRWHVLGPFPNPEHRGFDLDFGPEAAPGGAVDLAARVPVPGGGERMWAKLEGSPVDLPRACGGGDWRLAYGYARIAAARELETALFLGKDDGLKAWLNGELLAADDSWSHGTPDRLAPKARFRAGVNHLLVKCANHFGGWGFCVRPADPDRVLSW